MQDKSEPTQNFSTSEKNQLESLKFINKIDKHLKAVSDVKILNDGQVQRVVLKLDLFYDNDAITPMTFNLHNYSFDEIVDVARNIKDNEFILTEIDMMLATWGD